MPVNAGEKNEKSWNKIKEKRNLDINYGKFVRTS
jgi:predicted nucleotidyltransferase